MPLLTSVHGLYVDVCVGRRAAVGSGDECEAELSPGVQILPVIGQQVLATADFCRGCVQYLEFGQF